MLQQVPVVMGVQDADTGKLFPVFELIMLILKFILLPPVLLIVREEFRESEQATETL